MISFVKEMATYKMSVLQQALDNSVPAYELERANKQYNELTAKYRDILQRENTLVQRSVTVETLEVSFVPPFLSGDTYR